MRDVVIVPTYERQEYAWVCLEYLSRARGIEDKEVWLCQDNHEGGFTFDPSQGTEDIRKLAIFFGKTFGDRACWHGAYPHNTYGNSKNLVDSLRRAYDAGAERIFLVEDDIMVAPDFFLWHEAVLKTAHPFVSCASALNKSAHFQINGPQRMEDNFKDPWAYKQVIGPYSSHAAAFPRHCVGDLLKHFDRENIVWESGREQDLIIQNYLLSHGHRSAWPYVPRAFNVGMYSYHISGMRFNGTLEEKCAALRATITNAEKLREMSCNNAAVTAVPVFEGSTVAVPQPYQRQ